MDHIPPTEGVPAPMCVWLSHARPQREQRLCTHEPSSDRDHPPGNRRLRYPKAPTGHHHTMGHHRAGSASPHLPAYGAVPSAMPERPQHRHLCGCFRHHEPHPSNGGGALKLRTDPTGRLRQHHLTGATILGATILGASSHEELKTLTIISHPGLRQRHPPTASGRHAQCVGRSRRSS